MQKDIETAAMELERFYCNHKGCNLSFATEKELKKHKIVQVDHEYCRRCDEDFETEEQFLVHKIKSSSHIVCPMCGEEFKSDGGREGHIRQFHKTEQDLDCVGCKAKFNSAHGLMIHIEGGHCNIITREKYNEHRYKKQAIKDVFGQALKSDRLMPAIPTDAGSDDGGVKISLLDSFNHEKGEESEENLLLENEQECRRTPVPVLGGTRNRHEWPVVGKDKQTEDIPEDLMAFSEVSIADPLDRFTEKVWDNRSVTEGTSVLGWGKFESETNVLRQPPTEFDAEADREPANPAWDPLKFFNSVLGKYLCPCNEPFNTAKDFEAHLRSGVHAAGIIRCPGCLRLYKSISALVAHCESATTRCKISKNPNYNQIMDDISGGVLEADGYHKDGTVKYKGAESVKEMLKRVEW